MRRSVFLPFFVAAILPLRSHSQPSVERKLATQVSRHALLGHVKTLVGFGNRQGGTPSGDAASTYALNEFRNNRLDAIVESNTSRLVFVNHDWSLVVREPSRLRRLIKNEWLAGFSPSVSQRIARLVFLFLDERAERGSLDSCAVLTGATVTPELYRDLADAGAVCVLTFAPNDSRLYPTWALISELPASEENPIPVFNISYRNGETLRTELRRGTQITVRFSSRTAVKRGIPKTVIATLNGESDEYYIVCAHGDSDSGGPGADDNASGVAGVLELSRVLSDMVATKQLPIPKKSIKFIIWGSEYHSSTDFVKEHGDSLGKILGVMNFDEIGTGATRNCLYFEGNDISVNESLLKTLNAVGEEYAGRRMFWEEATTNPAQGGTDSYVFLPDYLEKLGLPGVQIPSVTVYTAAWNEAKTIVQTEGWRSKAWRGHPDSVTIDYSRFYHSSLDIPSLTTEKEPFNMEWAVRAVGITLIRLAWNQQIP